MTGPKDDTGDTGPQGPQGLTGLQGNVGPQSLQGLTGAQGPQGLTGAQGPQGVAGSQGPAGQAGAPGAQGPQGIQGEQGPAGPNKALQTRIVDGEVVSVESENTEIASAACAPGEIATGGGLEVSPTNPGGAQGPNQINAHYAVTGTPADDPGTWIVSYSNPGPNTVLIQAAAVCAQLVDVP